MSEEEQQAYRDLAVLVVYAGWRKLHRAVSLEEIYRGVNVFRDGVFQEHVMGVAERVESRVENDLWPHLYARFARSKRTVDRRVNEAAADDYYEDHRARIVCVTPGVYQPNPVFFKASEGENKTHL
jgi:hypothetical protein